MKIRHLSNVSLNIEDPDFTIALGNTTVAYSMCPRTKIVEFWCYPTASEDLLKAQRQTENSRAVEGLPERWKPIPPHQPEWLVQYKLAGSDEPGGHQIGRTQRGSFELSGLSFRLITVEREADRSIRITTSLDHSDGYQVNHVLDWHEGDIFFKVHCELINNSDAPLTVEYITSISLGRLSPFQEGEGSEMLRLHRFRTAWSAEGRHESISLEELHLEPSWFGFSRRSERFGQFGSLPVRAFFPWIGLEDTSVGVLWGVQLNAPGSWHLEASRCKDKVIISGGLPSRDFGEWWKTVPPASSFRTPDAVMACVSGDIDDLCHALTQFQFKNATQQFNHAAPVPIVYNEWCTSWGHPTHDGILKTARILAQTMTNIFVIDDGWAEKPSGKDIQFNGDWNVDLTKFPGGLKRTSDDLKALGLTPGLWFELEAATNGTEAFTWDELHLHRNGKVIKVGTRHFWDLRNQKTREYLQMKVVDRLKSDGFGYLKIDYNESLPSGVDGSESPGENLLNHLQALQLFIEHIKNEIPGILIENCSSGGHRLEPTFQAVCQLGSFSDAHETQAIPIIAANLHRLILPRQSLIWCVIHQTDSIAELRYNLSSTFLGRMCLSGDLSKVDSNQLEEILLAQRFYLRACPIIEQGKSRIYRSMASGWNQPRGWQIVVRQSSKFLLIVLHSFEITVRDIKLQLPSGGWKVLDSYGLQTAPTVQGAHLIFFDLGSFVGGAVLLEEST